MKNLLALTTFSVLLLVPTFGIAYGGGVLPGGTTTWIGTGDGESWSDSNNWNRVGGQGTQGQAVPQNCDSIIIDDGTKSVTVHFDLNFFSISHEMQIGPDDTLVIDGGSTLDHTPDEFVCEELDETITNNGNLNVFGTLINNDNFINNGQVLNCGTISGSSLPIPGIVNGCTVGGSLIPIDSTMLLLAGTQMTASWMIPVIVAGIGFAIVIARKF